MITAGINAGDVKKLQDAGIYTCNGLMMHTKKVNSNLINIFGVFSIMAGTVFLIVVLIFFYRT